MSVYFKLLLCLLFCCVRFNGALPTNRPWMMTANTMPPFPMSVTNRRQVNMFAAAVIPSLTKVTTLSGPRPVPEPLTITSQALAEASAAQVLEEPTTSTPTLTQWLAEAGVTLSPENAHLAKLLDRVDFDELERMCRQQTGLSHASNIIRSAYENQRNGINMANQIQSQMGPMNADAVMCSLVGKMGNPKSMFRDGLEGIFSGILSGIIPLKQNP